MSRIVCFGEALIDFHAQGAAFVPYPGGAPANVAVACARLGADVAFVGMLGADMFGDMLLAGLEQAGVDSHHVRRTDVANTALAFVSHDRHGERSFSFYRPPSADLLFRDDDFDPALFASTSIFHAGSCSLTEPAIATTTLSGMQRARDAGALVSFDMNLRPALWPRGEDPSPRIWQALDLADLVKLSAEELEFLGAPAIERLWQGRAHVLIVTDGATPIRWYTRDVSGTVPAFDVRAVDSTGAGDAFVGGLLYGLAEQGIDRDSLDAFARNDSRRDPWLRFAGACGALAVTRTGSFAAMPGRDEAERFLVAQA